MEVDNKSFYTTHKHSDFTAAVTFADSLWVYLQVCECIDIGTEPHGCMVWAEQHSMSYHLNLLDQIVLHKDFFTMF